jgi:hypothetical protein
MSLDVGESAEPIEPQLEDPIIVIEGFGTANQRPGG